MSDTPTDGAVKAAKGFGVWNISTSLSLFGSCLWNLSERLNINLRYLAPIVFGWMIGIRGRKVK